MERRDMARAETAVVGGGPTGLVAALALGAAGADTVLFAPAAGPDHRTTALLEGSVRALETLGAWPAVAPRAEPLARLRLVDGTRRILRAPEVLFDAGELGLPAFGYNVENETLRSALRAAVEAHSNVRIVPAAVGEVALREESVVLVAGDGRFEARLVVAADGRESPCRSAAGIGVDRREFPQVALALTVRHARPHQSTSTEFHTETGPFTLVPLLGNRSSLVWVVPPDQAAQLLALSDAALSREIETQARSLLGRMEVDGGRGSFPLASASAQRLAARRIALVGEAAHLLPPIGAQGLNLGIRDAATIAELVADARRTGDDLGGPPLLEAYDARRRPDVRSRALAVELMNRSLLSGFLPVHAARGFGLELASRFGFVRRALMRGGMGPRDDAAPRLVRGEAL